MKATSIVVALSVTTMAIGCGSSTTPTPKIAAAPSTDNRSMELTTASKSNDKGTSGMVSISADVR